MDIRIATRFFLTGSIFLAAVVTGCLSDNPATPSSDGDVKVKATSTDPRIAFMVESGILESAISMDIDEVTNDTTYLLFPVVSEEDKAKNLLVGGFGFTTMTLDAMINKKKNGDNVAEIAKIKAAPAAGLAKSSHTRWDYWYSLMDVKALHEVHRVRVFITTSGSPRLGPNWQAAVRAGIANWNNQAKGTAVSFVETTDPNNCDVKISASLGLGPDGTSSHMAFLTPDPYIEPNGVSLWVNSGYEHNGVPHNQKTTIAMSLLALATNITFTGMEGLYWNLGNVIHIPGTPVNDGDPYTPGSSILTYGTSPSSTPVMTQGDLKAFSTVYPLHGVSALTTWGIWRNVGQGNYVSGYNGSTHFQIAGDTVILQTVAEQLVRKIGFTGSTTFIWAGTGSNSVRRFIHSKGNLAMLTRAGALYTMMPGGGWVLQTTGIGANDFRLDGNRLSYVVVNPSNWNRDVYSKYITPTGSSATILDWSGTPNLSDFRVGNGLLLVADAGHVFAMQNYNGWIHMHGPGQGYAERLYLTDNIIAMYYYTPGNWNGSVAIRSQRLHGVWGYLTDHVYSPDDIDACGDKLAYLQDNAWLRVVDLSTWAVHEHYQLSNAPPFAKVQLTGANCDYVQAVDHSQNLWTKYGIDLNTDYFQHYSGVIGLQQKW